MAGSSSARRAVAVTGPDTRVGAGIAMALARAGSAVALVGDPAAAEGLAADLKASGAVAVAVPAALDGRAAAEAALTEATRGLGRLTGVAHAAIDAMALEPCALGDVDDARWEAVWEATMRSTLGLLQAAHAELRAEGGSILVVTPTLSLSGAPGLVPYTAAIEGQRLLAKSAARQWGPQGITVNCLAPAPELVEAAGVSVSLAPPALSGPGDPDADLGPVADFLLGPGAHFVTGATICVDGGVWMSP